MDPFPIALDAFDCARGVVAVAEPLASSDRACRRRYRSDMHDPAFIPEMSQPNGALPSKSEGA
jgi:hypothetical protein